MTQPIDLVLIDDELLMGPLFEGVFHHELANGSIRLHFFTSPHDGLAHLLKTDYENLIVITDIHMPDMNGFQLLASLREHEVQGRVFVVTAYEDVHYQEKMAELDIEACFCKPLDFDMLKERLLVSQNIT